MRIDRLAVAAAVLTALGACTRVDPDRFSGYAEADLVYVAPAIGGRIEKLAVERGARVDAGQLLFQLERDPESLARAAAAARADSAAAQARNLRKGKRVDELRAIEQQLAQARAALVLSTNDLKRNEELVAQGFISPNRLDELKATRDRDVARVAELQANLAVARDAARPDEIAAAEAEQRAAESDLASSRWREDQTRGVAPKAAAVQDVLYRTGEYVAQGAPVVALLPDGALKVRFFVPQAALARVRVGDIVAVSCDSCAAGLAAKVAFVSDKAEYTPPVIYSNESRAKLVFMVEAQPDTKTVQVLKPGQPVDVRIVPGT
ncbi:MAG TPA: HlyD family efflux transporter periplasmic adaptor subunit [Burkholderiaceae bacterium]|nr:HlyD family efflux transporter periplasmic adaptor subunit [Burkholderiaceae bacterium]